MAMKSTLYCLLSSLLSSTLVWQAITIHNRLKKMNNFEKMGIDTFKFMLGVGKLIMNMIIANLSIMTNCPPKQVKQASKLDNLDAESEELKKIIQAYCYQCKGQENLAENLKKEIRNEAYRAALED